MEVLVSSYTLYIIIRVCIGAHLRSLISTEIYNIIFILHIYIYISIVLCELFELRTPRPVLWPSVSGIRTVPPKTARRLKSTSRTWLKCDISGNRQTFWTKRFSRDALCPVCHENQQNIAADKLKYLLVPSLTGQVSAWISLRVLSNIRIKLLFSLGKFNLFNHLSVKICGIQNAKRHNY